MISVTLKAHIVQTLKGLRGYEATEGKVAVWFRRKRHQRRLARHCQTCKETQAGN